MVRKRGERTIRRTEASRISVILFQRGSGGITSRADVSTVPASACFSFLQNLTFDCNVRVLASFRFTISSTKLSTLRYSISFWLTVEESISQSASLKNWLKFL